MYLVDRSMLSNVKLMLRTCLSGFQADKISFELSQNTQMIIIQTCGIQRVGRQNVPDFQYISANPSHYFQYFCYRSRQALFHYLPLKSTSPLPSSSIAEIIASTSSSLVSGS